MKRTSKKRKLRDNSLWMIGISIAGVLACATALLWNHATAVYFKMQYFGTSPEPQLLKHLPELERDRHELSKYEIFSQSRGDRDAAKYMANLLKGKRLKLPAAVELQLQSPDWTKAKIDWSSFEPDFEWFTSIARFDYWNPDPAFEDGKKLTEIDLPDYQPLMRWSKLLMLSARDQGDVEGALRDARHLARLIWTNDQLVSAMVTVSMLKTETHFASEMGAKKVGSWQTIPDSDLDRAKRYFYAIAGALDPRLTNEAWNRIAVPGPGECLLGETTAMGVHHLMRTFLGDEFKARAERLDRVYAMTERDCRPSVYRQIWASADYPAFFGPGDDLFSQSGGRQPASTRAEKKTTLNDVRSQPAVARGIGYILGSLGSPNPYRYFQLSPGE